MTPKILPLTAGDAHAISDLAKTIWQHHYANIISTEQISYMLMQRYQPKLIIEQLSNPAIWWRKLILNDAIIGFSCCMRTCNVAELKLDKLYIHSNHQRKGYGAMLIKAAIKIMRDNDLQSLVLTVNKNNRTAISAYLQYGFTITSDSVVDIGGGFVMNDFMMTLAKPKGLNT